MIKEEIIHWLQEVLASLGISAVVPSVEIPTDISHGDYTTNIAMQLAKNLKKSPMEIAEEIRSKLLKKPMEEIETIEAVSPGFLNFKIAKKELINKMSQLLVDEEKLYSAMKTKNKKTIIVEYSSPNIAKPFTVGHLRSTIIGDAIANMLEALGHTVLRDNHIGDWGTQFGKQMYAIKNICLPDIDYGQEQSIGEKNESLIEHSDRPVKILVDLYVQFHTKAKEHPEIEESAREWFKKLEDGDSEARRLWQRCIDWSWKEFWTIYQTLGIEFTENGGKGFGESFVEDKMNAVIAELEEKNLLTLSDGAKVIFFPEEKYPPLLIVKKDGATLYATRDLAMDRHRLDIHGKGIIIINEAGSEQSLYFKQLYEVEQMLGWFTKDQRIHIAHGMYRFKEGKMSTRKGNVIWLEDVLDEATERAFNLQKINSTWEKELVHSASRKEGRAAKKHVIGAGKRGDLAEQVAVGAIKWNDLKRSSHMDITFDWDEILTMQGNSGPYIQYTFVRTQSIITDVHNKKQSIDDSLINNKEQYEIEELSLLRKIYQFQEIIQKAEAVYSPHILCEYLFTLCKEFNVFYQKHRILDATNESDRAFRLLLTQAVGRVIKNGLTLLGIVAPKEM